jgi:aryl-alcohol dehydrogenase-like predicted oxidoreductase
MRYRRLGRTDLRVSVIGVGTWQLGGEWGKDYTQGEADEIFDAARGRGINLIDTAECYGDHVSERLVGNAIHRDRGRWVVATKFGHHYVGWQNRTTTYNLADVQQQLDASLRALRTDYIDLYQFHSGRDEHFQTEGLWDFLRKQQQAGKVRHLGVSISQHREELQQVVMAANVGAGAVQLAYNRLDRTAEQNILPSCRRQDLGVLARVPMATGLLSGKYKLGDTFAEHDVRSSMDPQFVFARLREVERIAREEVPPGTLMSQWALAWCLRHEAVTCVIPGCRTAAQVEANADAVALVSDDHPSAWPEERPPSQTKPVITLMAPEVVGKRRAGAEPAKGESDDTAALQSESPRR